MKFSTIDRDNDVHSVKNCAAVYGGGNWYRGCHRVLLTGKYFGRGEIVVSAKGVTWFCHKGHAYSFKRAEMKIFVSHAFQSIFVNILNDISTVFIQFMIFSYGFGKWFLNVISCRFKLYQT